jgi:uncharacterized protein YsxB (DUF464 family)
MIEINIRFKKSNEDGEWFKLFPYEMHVVGHSRQTKVCNMVSAISLYGIKTLMDKQWFINNKSGYLYITHKTTFENNAKTCPSLHDQAVMKTIATQLILLSKEFKKEITLRNIVDETL